MLGPFSGLCWATQCTSGPPACVDARVRLQELEKAIVDEQIRLSQACTDMGIKVWMRRDTVPILQSRPCSPAVGAGVLHSTSTHGWCYSPLAAVFLFVLVTLCSPSLSLFLTHSRLHDLSYATCLLLTVAYRFVVSRCCCRVCSTGPRSRRWLACCPPCFTTSTSRRCHRVCATPSTTSSRSHNSFAHSVAAPPRRPPLRQHQRRPRRPYWCRC